MSTRNNNTDHKAFTLIELLVVISIISLLISILLPALSAARESAKRIQCASQERQIQIALSSYTYDNDGYAPPCYWGSWSDPDPTPPQYWSATIAAQGKYLSNAEIFWCPIRDRWYNGGDVSPMMTNRHNIAWAYTGYGVNYYGIMPSSEDAYGYQQVNIDAIPASKIVAMAEVQVPSYLTAYTPGRDGWNAIAPKASAHRLITHQGTANISFFDGHVESVPGEEIGWSDANNAWDATYDRTQSPWYFGVYTKNTP